MKNIWIKAIAFCVISLTATSCSRSFEEINTDTSKITEPTPASLLAPVQYNMAANAYLRANDFTFDIMQIAIDFPGEGNNISRYYVTESTGSSYWNTSYKWLKQIKQMQDLAIQQNNKNYQAIAMVMNAWLYSNLTDTFGDIPFSEASNIEGGVAQPKFDKQKDIYIKLLDDLKAANGLFVTTSPLSGQDLFYNANNDANGVTYWKKFCNSLSLRLLTRILKKNGEVNVYERIQEIVNNPTVYPIFQNNTESALMSVTGIAPMLPPLARPQDFTSYRAVGEFFVNTLNDNKDPRLAQFFTQAKNLSDNKSIGYKGAPVAYANGTTFTYQPSNFNQNLAKAPLKVLILPYAEVQFILSELAFKGIISGNAQTFYENGVKAAIEQWGAVVPTNYFTNAKVAYDGTLERIMLQKYVALFFVDQQQWFEHKRTGYPVLPNNGGLLNDGKMPQRLLYPTQPKILNTANYNAAVQSIGGDNINIKDWWNQ